ncbi:probable aquaporin NIP7-1 isoform X1 [Rhododendron vialii]|uniref:probable aquaporin NIP7-1 isoform X1 n=1 Tax=Rhododendron vialii TaxID=182163 RepID=UPI00265E521C|nr:probable aquaporin NIP7-1 isoform X1 [Rhododendron vialii]
MSRFCGWRFESKDFNCDLWVRTIFCSLILVHQGWVSAHHSCSGKQHAPTSTSHSMLREFQSFRCFIPRNRIGPFVRWSVASGQNDCSGQNDILKTFLILAEAIGTFILMFCICAIIAITQLMRGEVGLLEYAATAALSVVVIVFSIGAISGAHVNPAVTIAFATCGQFPWSKVPLYIMAQGIGSVLATYVGKLVYGISSELLTTRPLQGSAAAFWVELIATLIIMFLASALTHHAKYIGHLAGFIVGTAIGLAVLITGPVSGGSMNPARSLGPALVSWKFDDVWIYLTAPTIGAVAGAFLYSAIRLRRHACCSDPSPDTAQQRQSSQYPF